MTDPRSPIGVLALQGDFECHRRRLMELGADVRLVGRLTISNSSARSLFRVANRRAMLTLARTDLLQQLRLFVQTRPTLGTCAGAILLARSVDPPQPSLGAIDITIRRNAYGRQVDSSIRTGLLGTSPIELVFIRAPRIVGVGVGVDVLARERHDPVLVRQGLVMAATFHPELGEDTRVMQMFLGLIARDAGGHGSGSARAQSEVLGFPGAAVLR